ncbi:hypothetical protein A5630_25440 [Mycolicibacterium mucogenicum]|uniref:Uncharacterized protein n=1 Tax=Mycolicibacterium mucogenicum TaxID=56689 RepID=A0A1A3GY47_MYCMU|nr:hypothetical protein [Mycolicibacterium mucogenicum]OBJ40298.1 hypothetical protein A5630_25440 [Mycolicibacterium mucogenicum]
MSDEELPGYLRVQVDVKDMTLDEALATEASLMRTRELCRSQRALGSIDRRLAEIRERIQELWPKNG